MADILDKLIEEYWQSPMVSTPHSDAPLTIILPQGATILLVDVERGIITYKPPCDHLWADYGNHKQCVNCEIKE